MTMVESFVKERNDALFSLDRRKIEAYLVKHGDKECLQEPDTEFWTGVFTAICNIQGAPKEVVARAHIWLSENGRSISS